jgi:hypothetical protein
LDLECVGVDSNITESIVNFVVVQLVDETTKHLLTSIGTFCFFVETISNEKKNKNGINELMPRLANNVIVFRNNLTSPLSLNVGPFLPFHPLHFLLSHSFQLVPRMQKFFIYTRKLFLGNMNGGMNKEAKRLV